MSLDGYDCALHPSPCGFRKVRRSRGGTVVVASQGCYECPDYAIADLDGV